MFHSSVLFQFVIRLRSVTRSSIYNCNEMGWYKVPATHLCKKRAIMSLLGYFVLVRRKKVVYSELG